MSHLIPCTARSTPVSSDSFRHCNLIERSLWSQRAVSHTAPQWQAWRSLRSGVTKIALFSTGRVGSSVWEGWHTVVFLNWRSFLRRCFTYVILWGPMLPEVFSNLYVLVWPLQIMMVSLPSLQDFVLGISHKFVVHNQVLWFTMLLPLYCTIFLRNMLSAIHAIQGGPSESVLNFWVL